MPHYERNLNKKVCLTCHFFQINRRVRMISNVVPMIEFDEISGTCTLLNRKFPHSVDSIKTPPFGCRYKRWYDLP